MIKLTQNVILLNLGNVNFGPNVQGMCNLCTVRYDVQRSSRVVNASWVMITGDPPKCTGKQPRLKRLPSRNFIGGL